MIVKITLDGGLDNFITGSKSAASQVSAMEERIVKETFHQFFLPTLTASITLSVLSMTDLIIAGRFVG